MSFPTWKTNTGNSYVFPNSILDGQVDISGTFYNRLGNVIIGDSSNPDFDPSSNGITLNTTRICLGKDSSVTGDNGVAIGNSATTGLQENSISIGYNSIVDASNSVAIGADASANGLNSIALGYNSGTGSYTNSVALGANSTVGANNVISLGDGTQKVGIGVTNPTYTLDISAGTLGSDTDASLNYIRFKSTNPNMSYLDIYERRFDTAGDWQTASTRIQKTIDTTKQGYIEFNASGNGGGLAFGANNDEKMTITSNGNVGIGTSNPNRELDVDGSVKITNWFRVSGNGGIHWEDYSGGWYMSDSTWLRTWNNRSIWAGNGTIATEGRVGIGNSAPIVPLHINTSINKTIKGTNGNDSGYYNGVHAFISNTNYGGIAAYSSSSSNTNPISIYTPEGYIASKGIYTARSIFFSSDRRIKSNISDINDDEALQKLRLFKPCKYTYIDYRENNTIPVYGFIAQEIKEVLPYAVDDTLNLDNEIPNIYRFCNITNDTILSFFDYDNSFDLSYNGKNYNFSDGSGNTSVFEKDLSGNICAIIFKSKNGVSLERKVINIIDENTFEIDCSFNETEILEDNTIFAYGQKVVNFNKLKKEAIFTVATAALQEVDRQLQAEKVKTATLETQITDILARLDALENP
jgi:hypothetical protein